VTKLLKAEKKTLKLKRPCPTPSPFSTPFVPAANLSVYIKGGEVDWQELETSH